MSTPTPPANQVTEEAVALPESMVSTGGGGSLDAHACNELLLERGGILIGIVAAPDVGKTTMIAKIYELALRRKFGSFKFAGSETLRGYEERCHLSRIASNRPLPDTPRTRMAAKLNFTHLNLVTSSGKIDMIFSDRSGEYFDTVLGRPAEIINFTELRRSNVILLLVDLAALAKSPHVPQSQVRRLFMAMSQHGHLNNKSVWLVGTKADLMTDPETLARAENLLAEMTSELAQRTKEGERTTVRQIVTSSRRNLATGEAGQGLERLLEEIVGTPLPQNFMTEQVWPKELNELDALMYPYRSKSQ
ncbi:TRAFAC clade GTPase domain-containing protein [Herbaspirillum huttiense]|uniref:TRAFAC clade GTPase domain-containing protein n=1 Tax=Herbaspirillum huttiense TaxID=863372 RepID=UPI0031D835BC